MFTNTSHFHHDFASKLFGPELKQSNISYNLGLDNVPNFTCSH